MSKLTVNTTAASGANHRARVSYTPVVETQYQPSTSTNPFFMSIDGPLPEGRLLAHPIVVKIEDDDGEFLISEPHFSIHASGPTLLGTIEAFKRVFSGYLDVLSEDEEILGIALRRQLEYLRSAIRVA